MTERRAYPSDLSNARWTLFEPTLTAWRQAHLDRGIGVKTPTCDLRDILNAILHANRTGIAWKYLPHDFPPHQTVHWCFSTWTKEGVFTQLGGELTGLARAKEGREPQPTACVIDTQSVKTYTNVPSKHSALTPERRSPGGSAGSPPTASRRSGLLQLLTAAIWLTPRRPASPCRPS